MHTKDYLYAEYGKFHQHMPKSYGRFVKKRLQGPLFPIESKKKNLLKNTEISTFSRIIIQCKYLTKCQ